MQQFIVEVKSVHKVTHNVIKIVTDKPPYYNFWSGQATDVSINKPGWSSKRNPFTFTSIPADDYLEFTIKLYPKHDGVTNELRHLKKDDRLIIRDVYGAINYTGEGVFIAGGAGITPFMSIIRHLHTINELGANKLIFANKTKDDIIYEEELKSYFGKNFLNILSDEKLDGYDYGHIDAKLISQQIFNSNNYFYICGPEPMMQAVDKQLASLEISADYIVKEGF